MCGHKTNEQQAPPIDDGAVVLRDIDLSAMPPRYRTQCRLDELFGGREAPGIMPGGFYLVTGGPGSGKSTLSLQLADILANIGVPVLYNSNEEAIPMIKMRADRLQLRQYFCIAQYTSIDEMLKAAVEMKVKVVIQDSLQTIALTLKEQKEAMTKLRAFADNEQIAVFLVGHVTKTGRFAGPQTIEHVVDAHLGITVNASNEVRTYSMDKNRFGPTHTAFEFRMSKTGLDFFSRGRAFKTVPRMSTDYKPIPPVIPMNKPEPAPQPAPQPARPAPQPRYQYPHFQQNQEEEWPRGWFDQLKAVLKKAM